MPNHPAYEAIKLLAQNQDFAINNAERWRLGEVDPETVQDAAVLILFGVLDDAPAHSSACPDAVGSDLDVLIVVRAGTLRKHAGQPAFPGGKVDPEDYDLARETGQPVAHVAALREAVEETGLDPAGVEILGALPAVPLPVSNFMVTPVLAWWKATSFVEAQDVNESSLVVRVPVADLLNPARRHMSVVKRGNMTHKSPAFTVDSQDGEFVIWGFTGVLLDQILTGLGWTVPWDKNDKRPAPGF